MEANLSFGYVMVPKINQKIISIQHRLDLVRKITIRGSVLVKIEKINIQGYFTKVSIDTPEGNQLSHFKNGYFSKNLW